MSYRSLFWACVVVICLGLSSSSSISTGDVHVAASLSSAANIPAVKALVRSTFQTSTVPGSLTFHLLLDEDMAVGSSFELLESWVSAHKGTLVYHAYSLDGFDCSNVAKEEQEDYYVPFVLEKILGGIQEVIYLSADVIVAQDICEFYRQYSLLDGNEFVVRAFTQPDGPTVTKTPLSDLKKSGIEVADYSHLTRPHNAVLLLNLKVWRAQNISSIVRSICTIQNNHQTPLLLDIIYRKAGRSLSNSLIERNFGSNCSSLYTMSSSTIFLQWNGKNKPWLSSSSRDRCSGLWEEFSEGPHTKYLFRFDSALFVGFTAPRPENSSEYFNRGSGNDWIARLPQFVASNSKATVYVCESGRIIRENLGSGDSSVHKLIPTSLHNSKCGSKSVSPVDARLLKFDVVVVRQTAEIPLMRRIFGDDPPNLTAIFPLQYRLKKKNSNCQLIADVCIPDNYLFKGLGKDMVKKCAPYGRAITHSSKRQLLLYPAKIYPRKGQLEFLQSIRAELLQRFTIQFIGPKNDLVYAEKVANLCTEKELSCVFSGRLPQEDIFTLFKEGSVYGVVSFGFGDVDPNPRIVGESLSCGVPVIVGPTTIVPEIVESHFPTIGSRIRNLNEANEVFADWINRNFSQEPTHFYQDHGSEKKIYESLFMNIYQNSSWRTGWTKRYPGMRI